jgi:hypothetical protein
VPQLDLRMALAAEYSAYQMGQLNKKLDKLIELLLSTRALNPETAGNAQVGAIPLRKTARGIRARIL